MEDGSCSNDYDTTDVTSAASMERFDSKMLLLRIAENEKSQFEDELPADGDADNGFTPQHWKESESSVTATVPAEWLDVVTMAPEPSRLDDSAPNSYYELADLNMEPAGNSVRFARVPSQYQLDALSEMFIYDVPLIVQKVVAPPTCAPAKNPTDGTPFLVHSEYVSELLM